MFFQKTGKWNLPHIFVAAKCLSESIYPQAIIQQPHFYLACGLLQSQTNSGKRRHTQHLESGSQQARAPLQQPTASGTTMQSRAGGGLEEQPIPAMRTKDTRVGDGDTESIRAERSTGVKKEQRGKQHSSNTDDPPPPRRPNPPRERSQAVFKFLSFLLWRH